MTVCIQQVSQIYQQPVQNYQKLLCVLRLDGATVLLLRQYSQKLGKIKYWIAVSIPLAYFLSEFIILFLNLFTPLLQSNAIFCDVLLTLTFTLSKPAGGLSCYSLQTKLKCYLLALIHHLGLLRSHLWDYGRIWY